MAVTEVMTRLEKQEEMSDELSVIILLEKNISEIMKPYDIYIWGKKMWEWVALSCDGYFLKTIPCTPESDVLNLVKPLLSNTKYTLVLYSDTPLFKRKTLTEIMTYVKQRDLNVLCLERGYLFNTEYIKNAESICALPSTEFGEDDFLRVQNNRDLTRAMAVLRNRILSFHIQNGIQIIDPNTCYIDADVIIEKGTIIEPNTYLKGASFIGKNCRIEFGSVIENSIISDGCVIKNSYISESRISENTVVGPLESVIAKSS